MKRRMRRLMVTEMTRWPCGIRCDCEWGSLRCFEKNGYMYDHGRRRWLRDENGYILIGKKECDAIVRGAKDEHRQHDQGD